MKATMGYRDMEKLFREAADAVAKCAELEESKDCTEAEMEEAVKNFMIVCNIEEP